MSHPDPGAPPLADWLSALTAPARAVAAHEMPTIAAAGQAMAERLAVGGRLLTFGAGHSWSIAAELSSRAGGLRDVVALSLADVGPARDQWWTLADSEPERDPARAGQLIDHYGLAGADTVLIVTNSGRNGAIVELAARAQRLGCLVVAIVSLAHCAAVASRHPDGTKVTDHADFIIDNHGCPGDAAVEISPGVMAGPTSTVAGGLIVQLLGCTITWCLAQAGPVTTLTSANVDPPSPTEVAP
jgi:uncharacterized phosphosugar-binding protein